VHVGRQTELPIGWVPLVDFDDLAARRVIVCGGDTSSRVTRLLGVESLSIAANPWGNVVLLRAHAEDPAIEGLELLLKGGQVGSDSLFIDVAALGS